MINWIVKNRRDFIDLAKIYFIPWCMKNNQESLAANRWNIYNQWESFYIEGEMHVIMEKK